MSRMGSDRSPRLQVGFARETITPAWGVPLAGYFNPRPNRGVLDPLYARALLIQAGDVLTGIVSCDLIFTSREIMARVTRRLQRHVLRSVAPLIFCATHTHTGPYVAPLFGQKPDKDYIDGLVGRLVAVVRQAHADLHAAEILYARVASNPFAFNRRFFMRDGTVVTNPGKMNRAILRPEGPVDREVGIVAVKQSGRISGIVANIVNHSDTIGGDLVSADWPGQLEKWVQREMGYEVPVITLIGASGNINHFDVAHADGQTDYDEAKRIGRGYARIVLNGLDNLKTCSCDDVRVGTRGVAVRYARVSASALQAARDAAKQRIAGAAGDLTSEGLAQGDPTVERFFAEELLRFHSACAGRRETFGLAGIALGDDLAIVSLPGEPFTEIGIAIKERSPFEATLVASLANGACGYVPLAECFARGGYETRPVVGGGACEDTAGKLIEGATDLLRNLKRMAIPGGGKGSCADEQ